MAATWSEDGLVGQRPTCLSYPENAMGIQYIYMYSTVYLTILSIIYIYIYIQASIAFILITSLDWFFPNKTASIAIAGANCLEYLVANRSSPLHFEELLLMHKILPQPVEMIQTPYV